MLHKKAKIEHLVESVCGASCLILHNLLEKMIGFIWSDQFSAERIGRKKTVITLVGINIIGILIEGFSVCWEMMMTCLFVVGFALGGKSRK